MRKGNLENLTEREDKFNNFLNKVIVLSSKEYYRKKMKLGTRELQIIDNEEYTGPLLKNFFSDAAPSCEGDSFVDSCENMELYNGFKSLSDIERAVIFLLYEQQLKQDEAATILKICSKSVSRINKRAINKLKDYMKGEF